MTALERVAFFEGQRLAAADLEAAQAHDRELRELHSRALHDWGVASGLGVSGKKGDREVRVASGHALNRWGRELIVTAPLTVPVPQVAGAGGADALYALWLAPAEGEPTEMRAGVCAPPGAVRISDAPAVVWRGLDDRRADEVALARVRIRNCRLSQDPSPEGRRDAIAGPRPRIASGETPSSRTRWRFWPDATDAASAAGVATFVDTATGGFGVTPHYQARVAGERTVERSGTQFMADGHPEVHAASAAGFTLRMVMPRDLSVGEQELNPSWAFTDGLTDVLRGAGWRVVWLGVEP